MRSATISLESIAPYSQSRKIDREFPKAKNIDWNEYEEKTWREKAHYTEDGKLFIPQFAFKQSLDSASKYLGKMSGKGGATWVKRFVGGVVVRDSIILPYTRDDVTPVWISANADGKRGSGKRVDRCFPVIPKWSGSLKCIVLADEITQDIFLQAWELSGSLIGIGRFRPENGGNNGRFLVKGIKWE